jgi:hypothetical protein
MIDELEAEIIDLSGRWCRYVGMDHCKSRDFYWYITKSYSYGESPKYYAYHNGYRADDWTSQEVDSEEDAMMLLADKLRRTIKNEIKIIKRNLEETKNASEDERWYSVEELQKELDVLQGGKREHDLKCDSVNFAYPTYPVTPAKCTCGVDKAK